MTIPVRITARLDAQSVGLDRGELILDGPLSWAWFQRRGSARLAPGQPVLDADLPLARWHEGGAWGWCVSRCIPAVAALAALEIRRKPNMTANATYTKERRFHPGLGPHKARDVIKAAAWVTSCTWHAVTTSVDDLHDLLMDVTHLGAHAAAGLGHVADWSIVPHDDPQAWRNRPMPDEAGAMQRTRPPYWHTEGRVPCA